DAYYALEGANFHNDALSYYNSGNYEQALPAVNKAIEYYEKVKPSIIETLIIDYSYHKDLSNMYSLKGAILNEQNHYYEALISVNKSIDLDYNNAYAWNNKGNAFYHLGKYQEAIKCYDIAGRDPSLNYSVYSEKCLVGLKIQNESVGPREDLRCKCMGLGTKYIDTPNGPQPTCAAEGSSNLSTNGNMSAGSIGIGSGSPGNQPSRIEEQWWNRSSGFTYPGLRQSYL
ncbi:MAG: tetratricopeptide repeat protein, partial [Methanotrichaceae archaeon]